ncbi:MAG: zinc-dependent alcohol dehydrogenase family protein [Planctomycetota bacterium]|nr:zinc-dependent alcohol dehydrogenase family protein [Planctomycetota bacterium]
MKAMLLRKPGPIARDRLGLEEVPTARPGPGEVRIKVRACGVCHTDLHTCEGELPGGKLPVIPGHEIVGVVDELGQGVRRWQVDDRVGAAWLHRACGACDFCARGNENLCEGALFTGHTADGGYAEYFLAPADFIYPIPRGFSDREAAPLLCAGIVGYRALRLSDLKPGGRLAVFGFGASAHICVQVARHWGCEVLVFTRSAEHQELARKLGAAWVGQAGEEPPRKADSAIIFAPAGDLVAVALESLRKGGTLALGGIHMNEIPPLDYNRHLYYERTIRSVANSTRQDGHDLLRIAAEIPIRVETVPFPLEKANEALRHLKARQVTGAAVLEP